MTAMLDRDRELQAFDQHTVWHQEIKSAYESALRAIRLAHGDGRIAVVLGASGVGKQRLAAELRRELERASGRKAIYTPVASGSSSAPVSIGGLYDRILAELGAVGSHYVVTTSRRPAGMPRHATATQDAKLRAIENLLGLLTVPALIIDEAQYLVTGINPSRQKANLRGFTYLADKKCAPVVMLGTLELFGAIRTASDVHRRIRFIRFDRFRTSAQMAGFGAALRSYDTYLQGRGLLNEDFTLFDQRVRLHQATLGCIGNVHNLIYGALSDALEAGHPLGRTDLDRSEQELLPDRDEFVRDITRLERRLDRVSRGEPADPEEGRVGGESEVTPTKAVTVPKNSKFGKRGVGELNQIRHAAGAGRGLRPRGNVE
jgi:energy-coupling factor transporter ATP-binding protein EcfA2